MRDAPSPDRYHILTEFEEAVQFKRKGFSFGYGRQVCGGPMESVQLHKEIPGPGTYPSSSTLKSCNISLKPRLPDRSLACIADFPGPGKYELPSAISKDGKHVSSKYLSTGCPRIVPSHDRISTLPNELYPGPGECIVLSDRR
jgi:hypothetical protein